MSATSLLVQAVKKASPKAQAGWSKLVEELGTDKATKYIQSEFPGAKLQDIPDTFWDMALSKPAKIKNTPGNEVASAPLSFSIKETNNILSSQAKPLTEMINTKKTDNLISRGTNPIDAALAANQDSIKSGYNKSLAKAVTAGGVVGTGVGATGISTLSPLPQGGTTPEAAPNTPVPMAGASTSAPAAPAKELSAAVVSAPKLSTPELERLTLKNPEYANDLYQKALAEIQSKEEAAVGEYKESKNTRDWARIATTLGNALVKFGAARQGLRDNVDLSNIQTAEPDWQSMIKEDQDIRDQALASLSKQRASAASEQDSRDRKAERTTDISNRETESNWRAKIDADAAASAAASRESEQQLDRDSRLIIATLSDQASKEAAAIKAANPSNKDAIKRAQQRAMALRGYYGAIVSGADEKALQKAQAEAEQYLSPEQMQAIKSAEGSIWKLKKEARPTVLEGIIKEDTTPAAPTSGSVTMRHKSGATKTYAANDPKLQAILSNPDFERVE